ncbi:uncharacterized protein LOC126872552 isoform X2 [Bombus huntii]|uniref:uncharacterized protein LOC126872552 isoform X2 n=1 Tax=Bombus huntii TaxID=85661 RepID=UPI0021AAC9B6|nr:uncharacterized protein LOC126872552 isoform X2 [Bombus huntii]
MDISENTEYGKWSGCCNFMTFRSTNGRWQVEAPTRRNISRAIRGYQPPTPEGYDDNESVYLASGQIYERMIAPSETPSTSKAGTTGHSLTDESTGSPGTKRNLSFHPPQYKSRKVSIRL